MKTLTIRQVRAALAHLDEIVSEQGELIVTRRGRPLARILPVQPKRGIPSRAKLRATMPKMKVPTEVLIREDRDQR